MCVCVCVCVCVCERVCDADVGWAINQAGKEKQCIDLTKNQSPRHYVCVCCFLHVLNAPVFVLYQTLQQGWLTCRNVHEDCISGSLSVIPHEDCIFMFSFSHTI